MARYLPLHEKSAISGDFHGFFQNLAVITEPYYFGISP